MKIGVLTLEIHLPYAQSLKDKRKTVRGLKDRLRKRYNVAVAELDFQDKWQRTVIGVVTINSQSHVVEERLHRILADAHRTIEGEIVAQDIRFY